MPVYSFLCKTCLRTADEYQKMSSPSVGVCPQCGTETYTKVPSLPHTSQKEFHTPIEMHSIACNDMDEIREMQRAGVSISDDPDNDLFGVPIAHSRHEKLKALKAAGYEERS